MIVRYALAASLAWTTIAAGAGRADEPATPPATAPPAPAREAAAPEPIAAGIPRAPRPPHPPGPGRIPMAAPRPGEEARFDTLLVVRPPCRLELDDFGGQIVIGGWDRNAVRIQALHHPSARVQVDLSPAILAVDATRTVAVRDPRVGRVELPTSVNYHLSVPRWMDLRLSGVQTAVVVEGVQSEVSVETVSGPVAVRGGRGHVRVSAISGAVEVSGVRGSVEASSMAEGITIHDVEGPIRVESVNGDVDLDQVISNTIDASTVSGDLRYVGALRPGGTYRFQSHSGDVTIGLPGPPDVSASVNTWSGDFQSVFRVPERARQPRREFDFTLGSGRAEMTLESFSGAIRLVRAETIRQRVELERSRKALEREQRKLERLRERRPPDPEEEP